MMMTPPQLPPGLKKHRIVYLEEVHVPLPAFDFDHELTSYWRTEPFEVVDRIKGATLVITVVCPVTKQDLEQAPNVQLLSILATGMGWVDKSYCSQKDITVVNCPQSNVEALGEHFLSLYFASRRKIPELHSIVTTTREWFDKGSLLTRWTQGPPLSCAKETLGIVGYGALGRRFEGLARATGFGKIIVAERKGVTVVRPGRVSFDELIEIATTIVVCCPREPGTMNLIDQAELQRMRKEVLIINMARGGIVNESALAEALKSGSIYGAATDVLDLEPGCPGTSPLLPDISLGHEPIPNLIISPHVAWYAERTIERLQELVKEGLENFVLGTLQDGDDQVRNCVAVYQGKIWK